jgi:hypothetical protein
MHEDGAPAFLRPSRRPLSLQEESEDMENEADKDPKALPDEALDEAAGGVLPYVEQDAVNITDGTSNTKTGKTSFAGDGLGSSHTGASQLTKTGPGTLNFADGSVKPGA